MKNKTSTSKKLLAFLLATVMLFACLPLHVFASVFSNDVGYVEGETTDSIDKSEVVVLSEDVSRREENVKCFILSDGTIKQVSYAQAVHYKDGNGDWVDINNALTLSGNEYGTSNKSQIKFANKSGSNGLLKISDGEYKIEFTPLNTNKVNVEIENPQKNNSRKFDDVKLLTNVISKATYKDIYDGIDIEYILSGNNVKENIIVNKQEKSYSYSFEIKLNKLDASLENGQILLCDSETGAKIYTIPAPYMYDANGNISTDVEYSLIQNSKWKYTFTVSASADWINSDDRAFPVTIDPTVVADEIDTDTFVMSDNGNYWDFGSLIIGNFMGQYDSSGFMKFIVLPNTPDKSILVRAEMAMYLSYVENTDNIEFYIGIYKATQNWISNNNFTYATSSQFYESDPISSVQVQDSGTYEWDITSLYKQWKSGTADNYGVCVKGVELPFNKNANVRISTTENTDNYLIPQLELTYVDARGIEDYYGYSNVSLGTVGESYVNLYNGSLTYVNNLTTIENQVAPYEINMVYNSIDNSWIPNFNESIRAFDDFSDGIVRYVWTDEDGTIHNFAPYLQKNHWGFYGQYEESPPGDLWYVNNPVVFYPDDDIDYVLTKTTNGDFILKHYNGTQKFFDSSGKLLKICDAQGNILFFSYEDGKLSFIDCKTSDNELIAQARFLYENGNLAFVYNYTTELEVSLTWNNNGLSQVVYDNIDNTKDNTININYTQNANMIQKISDTLESKYIEYAINTNETVSTINFYSNDELLSRTTMTYNPAFTTCVNFDSNLIPDEDSIVDYVFDERGRNAFITYDESILPDDDYYDVEYSQNIYNQGGNLIKYDMTTEEKNFFNVIEQNIIFDLTDIITSNDFPSEGNSHDMVCKILVNNSDGTTSHNSGFLVGPNTLIMSAHGVLEDTTDDGILNFSFPTSITVTPGCNKNNQSAPYGNFQVTTCFIQKEYYYLQDENDPERFQYDWAVCTLDENIGEQLGWFDLIVPDESIIEQYALVCGYIGTTITYRQTTGQIIEFNEEKIRNTSSHTVEGMSGGPTFLSNADYLVIGIHVAGNGDAYAKRIDPLIYTLVSNLNFVE